MDSLSLIVLLVASIMALGGVGLVVARDLGSPERRLSSTARDLVEVLAPAIGLLILVWLVWRAVA